MELISQRAASSAGFPAGRRNAVEENAMQLYGNAAVPRVHALAMNIDSNDRDKEEGSEEPPSHEAEPPSLAGYIVYVITVLGFLTMCVSGALR
jgi:hypothetical protein